MSTASQPTRGRPNIVKGYGISRSEKGMLNWEWVEQQATKSRNYWICSTRPDGRPHAVPVWGVWVEGAVYFGKDPNSRSARNLAANPNVVVHLESGDEVVIFEGKIGSMPRTDPALLTRIADVYGAKYPGFRPDLNEPGAGFFVLRPHMALAWLEKDYPNTATRWVFEARK